MMYYYNVSEPIDDYDMVLQLSCYQCSKDYEILLVAGYVGILDVVCQCSAEHTIQQYEDGRVLLMHEFRLRAKPRLRLVRSGHAPAVSLPD